jgi:hypothetical protein
MSKAQGIAQSANQGQFKNRILNGSMMIDQRNAGASVALSGSSKYAVDRFVAFYTNTGGSATLQQSSVAPAGFTNSLLYSVTTGAAINNGDYSCIQQPIEGYNVADLGFGTADAKTVTLSFWVRSSLTGTFSGSLQNAGASRSYVYTYTISSANTWEYKTITITGDTSGTWLKTNGAGIQVYWNMGFEAPSTTSTINTWLAGSFNGAVGGVTPSTTSGATFYITGVQLEKGSTATSFDYRPYGTELNLCQRYAYQYVSPAAKGVGDGTNMTRAGFNHPVQMRAAPTATLIGTIQTWDGSTARNISSISNSYMTPTVFEVDFATGGSTIGRAMTIFQGTGSILVSAEL